jgi:hypothetical protein
MCHQINKDMVAVIQAEDDMMDLNPELKLKGADGSRRKQKKKKTEDFRQQPNRTAGCIPRRVGQK